MSRVRRVVLSDQTNFPAVCVGGTAAAGKSRKVACDPQPAGGEAPARDGGRRALELDLSPARPPVSERPDANRSWPAADTAAQMSQTGAMMPWDTPPMRRPKPDQSLLKGDNLFSFSFNGATTRSPYRNQQRPGDAAARSLNDSWAFYKSFSPADVLSAQTLFITPTKSVFTIDSRTSQILMWNDMASDLLGYSGSELSQLRLRDLFVAAESRPRMEEAHLSSEGNVVVFAGNVVEVKTKKGDVVPVSLWLRKIETSAAERRCVAVLEPVQRKTVTMTCDQFGRLKEVSGSVTDLFSQDADDFLGLKVANFLPALRLPTDLDSIPSELSVQEVTAKRSDGSSFPVSVRLTGVPASAATPVPTICLRVHAYTSLMGLVVMDEDLKIRNYNHNFISLTFGYEKGALIDRDVRDLIPTFEEDMEMLDSDEDSLSLPPIYEDPLPTPAAAMARLSLRERPPSPPAGRQPTQGDETRPSEPPSPGAGGGPPATSTPGRRPPAGRRRRPPLTDNTYYGVARHRDGSEFNITYDLCTIGLDDDSIVYCLWIGQDRAEPRDSLLSAGDLSAGVAHYSLGQVIQQQAAAAPTGPAAADSDDTEHCRGEYSRYYTTLRQIGMGAFGFVKLGYRNGDRLLVVTKFIRKDKVHADHWVDDPSLARRVPLEVSLLSMLNHPNIIRVLDVYDNAQYVQMVMERHGCMDLFEFIDRDPAMDEPLASHIFRQICSALSHLHTLEILHRDIKDENVIIDSSFHVKLIDFGSATFVTRGQLLATFCGTVEYCAPEVLLGHRYDGYTLEMWSLGVTLFTLLCRENPFHDVEDTISEPLRLPAQITPNLAHLLTGLLDKSPDTRLRLEEASRHPWTVQPIDLADYKFEEVVTCSPLEVSPPRYLSTAGLDGDQRSSGALSFSSLTHSTPLAKHGRSSRERREAATRNRVRSDETALGCAAANGQDPLHQSLHQ
ncbi:PAS domain-containing serine/threonine-protein kinase-like [Amphibalanus amphitrite]|uniref:PAS domain-containing serine/threonine-protein kinase-like n=1 Tax=Amphibalanus amphitrite TaxID=1232801 RepID=UPI001C91E6C2|nr:PAS domain-containing serine/threonine-protein kinase-like [Amphibalanus amphitrite]